MTSTRDRILGSALSLFAEQGYDRVSIAAIREHSGVSNGSFFHAFASKSDLAGELYSTILAEYHDRLLDAVSDRPAADGIAALIRANVEWVVDRRPEADFLLQQARQDWLAESRDDRRTANARLADGLSAWAESLIASGRLHALPMSLLIAELIGPAQIICRAWLAGRTSDDPRDALPGLIACAERALLSPG